MNPTDFDREIATTGYVVLPGVVPHGLVAGMLDALDFAYMRCRAVQKNNGVDEQTRGTVHHLPALQATFAHFLGVNPAWSYIERFFGGPYILNSFGGNFNFGGDNNYAGKVHRDIRTFSFPRRLLLNTLVMLDEFTAENGATWLLPGGQCLKEKPTDEAFFAAAVQVCAPAGSIVIWDSNLWHAAGANKTGVPRRSVTPMFSVPWFKPGFDYPRALGYDADLTETQRQILGYNARVPATLAEWYQPPEKRFYKGDQG